MVLAKLGVDLSCIPCVCMCALFFKKNFLLIFREKQMEEEREGEKHQCVVASHAPLTGDLACNPGMCPEWESNQQPFGSQAGT